MCKCCCYIKKKAYFRGAIKKLFIHLSLPNMKKVFALMMVAGMFAVTSCAPKTEENKEAAAADSVKTETAAPATATTDSTAKPAAATEAAPAQH
jgi:hypothetical protein